MASPRVFERCEFGKSGGEIDPEARRPAECGLHVFPRTKERVERLFPSVRNGRNFGFSSKFQVIEPETWNLKLETSTTGNTRPEFSADPAEERARHVCVASFRFLCVAFCFN